MEFKKIKPRESPRVFALVDTETTGLRAATGRIIDIAVIRIEDGVVTQTFQSLLNPGLPLSAFSAELTGINAQDVARAPVFEDIATELLTLFDGAVFVAHNAAFDYNFVKAEFRRLGIAFECPTLCTVQLSRLLHPTERQHDLDSVIARYGLHCDSRHRAFPDADVVRQMLEYLWQKRSVEADGAIKRLLYGNNESAIEQKVLRELPDSAGVYFFYGPDRELLYVGKSKHIRTRVRSHFSNKMVKREQALCAQTVSVEARTTHGELSALLLEASLIKEELPHYNRAARHRSELVTLVETVDSGGYKRGVLGRTQRIDLSQRVLSVFRSLAQAKSVLKDISREYKLCDHFLGMEKSAPCFGTQLGTCLGACAGREKPEDYNTRFTKAFRTRCIRTWPYTGTIAIEEKGHDAGAGTVFFVENWCLKASFTYDQGGTHRFLRTLDTFSYDTYKILARYILNKANRHNIKELSSLEVQQALQQSFGEYEAVVAYD